MNVPDKGIVFDFSRGYAVTLALFLAYIFLPLAGFLPGLYTPLPALFYTIKGGRVLGFSIVLVTAVSLAVFMSPTITLLYLFQGGLFSLLIPLFLAKGMGVARTIAYSVAVCFVCLLLVVASAWQFYGVDVHDLVLKGIDSSVSQTIAIYNKGGFKEDDLTALRLGAKELGEIVARIYPALVLVAMGIIAALNLQGLKRFAKKLECQLPVGELRTFRNPDHLIWFVIVPGFSLLAGNTHVTTAALNVLVVSLTLYLFQGMAVVLHHFDRYAVPGFVRITFYVMLTLQPYLAVALAVLGVFDLWGNFRTPRQHKNL